MAERKITCLGAGSLYFLRAIPDLLVSPEIAGSEIVLYDIEQEKSERMAAMGRRLAEEAGTGFRVRAASGLDDAVDGAHFAISSIGGSGADIASNVYASAYHAADIRIPAKYGIHQVVGDTCGPAAMMMGLRSIPAYLEICRRMEQRCPDAVLLSHSNPMAVLCRAMRKYTSINVIGICHGVQGGVAHAAGILEVPAHELECLWIGTNHYYWFTRVLHKGVDVYPELMARMASREHPEGTRMSAELSGIYGYHIVYPEDDHIIEFYPFLAQSPSDPDDLPYGLPRHWHAFNDGAPTEDPSASPAPPSVRASFFAGYQEILDRGALPGRRDDTLTGEGIGALVGAIATGGRRVCVANLANGGAITNLPATAEVEVEAVTDSRGVRALQMGECPLVLKGMLEKRFVWHELVADAAVKGDRKLALQAMLADEMAIWPSRAADMLDELLEASRGLLPQFEAP